MSFHLISFYYKVDEILEELNSSLYQLYCGKIDFVICHFAAVPRTSLLTTLSEDLLYLKIQSIFLVPDPLVQRA